MAPPPTPACPLNDPLFAAVGRSGKEPWRLSDVDQAGCSVEGCEDYTLHTLKLNATDEAVVERATDHSEFGMFTYGKSSARSVRRAML